MMQIYAGESKQDIVFHFNKKHLEDSKIPMWVVKSKGTTYYIDHLDSRIGFSTKETPDNSHTKGSIKFKGMLTITQDSGITTALIE